MQPETTRKTKIIATLGPASLHPETLLNLTKRGVDAFRLNFSHALHEDHKQAIDNIRKIEKKIKKPLGIIADLQGPKYRIGLFDHPIFLEKGHIFTLDLKQDVGSKVRVCFPHEDVYPHIQTGHEILLNDGKIRLKVKEISAHTITTQIIVGGEISSNKGVNLPQTQLQTSPLTPKDRDDLRFILSQDIDFIALSFVQKASDIEEARKLIGKHAWILAKIEKPQALQNLSDILQASDGLLVARGDLGVEMLPEEVPNVQRQLVQSARGAGKPVIIATQMMESMITNPTPTRAEASDVANAVFEGADGVMLSAETAAGNYPLETVAFMDRILRQAEKHQYSSIHFAPQKQNLKNVDDATIQAATWMAEAIDSPVMITVTCSGSTALRAAQQRPKTAIFALTSQQKLARQLTLVWGVAATHTLDPDSFREVAEQACTHLLEKQWAKKGDPVVITAGAPFKTPGSTNMVRVAYAGHEESYASL